MPARKTARPEFKPKPIGTEFYHCSQCNRPSHHLLFSHPDGKIMQCQHPGCGYEHLEIVSKPDKVSEPDGDES